MLRTTSGLSRPVLKWVSQVAASLGATLSATLIWSAMPHPGAAPVAMPEVTSGGKFAARAIQPVVIRPIAYDGLDTMPLPHLAPPPARFAALPVEAPAAAGLHRASWDEAAPAVPTPVRIPRAARSLPHAEAHRLPPAVPVAAASPPVMVASQPEAAADEGFLHAVVPSALPRVLPAIVSTAREAWTVTASAGGTLVSRVVPQIP